MESPDATVGSYSGLSPLMSSILELTREIENLDEEPLVQRPRKVLWAKKRFPRQGIRCTGATRTKRWKYIGATAKDFPYSILRKSAFTSPVPNIAVPPLASETFRREGSAETHHGTESSASDPERSGETQNRDTQPSLMDQEETANLNGSHNECYADNNDICEEMQPQVLHSDREALDTDNQLWHHENSLEDEDEGSNRAIDVSAAEDQSSVYSSYSTRNDEISIAYHCDSTVSYQEAISYDVESENFDHANTGFEVDEGHFEVEEEYVDSFGTTEDSNTRMWARRIPGKVRALEEKRKEKTSNVDVETQTDAGPSSQDSGTVSLGSCRKTRVRGKVAMGRGSDVCQGGKKCFACSDTRTTKEAASEPIVQSPKSRTPSPERTGSWTKKEWDDFFCLFSAVAAEAHTLQSLGSNNMVANKRWLGCMRTLLQKPPF